LPFGFASAWFGLIWLLSSQPFIGVYLCPSIVCSLPFAILARFDPLLRLWFGFKLEFGFRLFFYFHISFIDIWQQVARNQFQVVSVLSCSEAGWLVMDHLIRTRILCTEWQWILAKRYETNDIDYNLQTKYH